MSWACWSDAESVLQGLGLHYRVVKLAAGDTGFGSAPSTSRCGSPASRPTGRSRRRRTAARSGPPRGITKAKDGTRGFAATLNSSGLPIQRTLVAFWSRVRADGRSAARGARPLCGFDVLTPDNDRSTHGPTEPARCSGSDTWHPEFPAARRRSPPRRTACNLALRQPGGLGAEQLASPT
jgi:hypothetical protein